MKIAVEGCCHGELHRTYAALKELELQTDQKADILIICGDFQAIRNQSDLLCMAVPQKYRQLGQFHEYYTGEKVAPVLTIVVGGNHEASNYMWELYHGGWLAPNIYYLGGSGCVRLNGIRIAGASGIFKHQDYNLGHYERIPYDNSSLRSVYHVRAYDVLKLSLLTARPEIFISHDWPEGIYNHGDTASLLVSKPFFKQDIAKGELGNPYMMDVLKALRPLWWFSAHLHVRFQAEYDHTGQGVSDWGKARGGGRVRSVPVAPPKNADEIVMEGSDTEDVVPVVPQPQNTDEIVMDDDDDDDEPTTNSAVESQPPPSNTASSSNTHTTQLQSAEAGPSESPVPSTTKFLALDKCLPRRKFLEIVDVPSTQTHSPPRFTYDTQWLAISRAMHPLLSTERRSSIQPRINLARGWVETEMEWVKQKIASRRSASGSENEGENEDEITVESVQQFVMTAPGPSPSIHPRQHPAWYTNPQTEAFCALLEIENKVNPVPPNVTAGQ